MLTKIRHRDTIKKPPVMSGEKEWTLKSEQCINGTLSDKERAKGNLK